MGLGQLLVRQAEPVAAVLLEVQVKVVLPVVVNQAPSGGSSSGSSQSSASGDTSYASAGTHFNIELCLLYSYYEDGDGNYDRSYGDNYALDHDITEDQLKKKCIEYWNDDQHYNFLSNNCAEIASKHGKKLLTKILTEECFGSIYT